MPTEFRFILPDPSLLKESPDEDENSPLESLEEVVGGVRGECPEEPEESSGSRVPDDTIWITRDDAVGWVYLTDDVVVGAKDVGG